MFRFACISPLFTLQIINQLQPFCPTGDACINFPHFLKSSSKIALNKQLTGNQKGNEWNHPLGQPSLAPSILRLFSQAVRLHIVITRRHYKCPVLAFRKQDQLPPLQFFRRQLSHLPSATGSLQPEQEMGRGLQRPLPLSVTQPSPAQPTSVPHCLPGAELNGLQHTSRHPSAHCCLLIKDKLLLILTLS